MFRIVPSLSAGICQGESHCRKREEWRGKRKLLTPTFHYDILKDFLPVFNAHAKTFVEKMDKGVGLVYTGYRRNLGMHSIQRMVSRLQ